MIVSSLRLWVDRAPVVLVFATAILLGLAPAGAVTRYVDDSASGLANGTSWTNAYPTVQDALAAAGAGDEIWVAAGVYYPDEGAGQTDDDPASTFQLVDGVALYGGFAGDETALADREPTRHLTILSGDLAQDDLNDDGNAIAEVPADIIVPNAQRVVTATGNDATAVLDGFVITAGNADATGVSTGGGLIALGGSPTIRACRFSGNRATGRGGALYLAPGDSLIENCLFSGNRAVERGGAFATLAGAAPELRNCVFRGNVSKRGGAANINDSSPTFINCSFSGNDGTINGGALQGTVNAVLTFANCVTWNNRAAGSTTSPGASMVLINGATYASSYSLFENVDLTGTGVGNLDGTLPASDPLFAIPPDPADAPSSTGDLRVATTSPVIDRGDNGANPATHDPDGRPRALDGDYNTTATVDLGAYELPRILHVDKSAVGAGTGESWADAFTTLRAALNSDADHDEIWVAAGAYYPDEGPGATPNSTDEFFTLDAGSTLRGGFAGSELHRHDRDPASNVTILSGDITQNDFDNDGNLITEDAQNIQNPNSGLLVWLLHGDARLDGFTITAASSGALVTGASSAGAVVSGCRFAGNRESPGNGGAAYVNRSITFDQCHFEGCTASGDGGAVMVASYAAPRFTGCVFRNNRAERGGAVFITQASPLFFNVRFEGNSAYEEGGAIYHDTDSQATLINCVLLANTAENGGGVLNHGATLTATNCILTGNEGDGPGDAGAIANERDGAGFSSTPGIVNLTNTIVWENFTDGASTSQAASLTEGFDATTSFSHSLVENWDPPFGPGNLDGTDPANDPLLDPATGVPSLSSPVADLGDSTAYPVTLPWTDLDGDPRVHGGAIDLGAYERNGPGTVAVPPAFLFPPNSSAQTNVLDLATIYDGSAISFAIEDVSPDDVLSASLTGSQLDLQKFQQDALGVVTVTVSASDGAGATTLPLTVQVSQSPLFVDHAAAGAGSGLTWADAFPTVQDALVPFMGAAFPVEVWVAEGTYYPDEGLGQTNGDPAATFLVPSHLSVCGGFAAGATSAAERDPDSHPVILSGDLDQSGTTSGNAATVVTLADGSTLATATVTGGYHVGGTGGGIVAGEATIDRCRIIENTATNGAGAAMSGSAAVFTNCLLAGNHALAVGGGAHAVAGATPTFTNCAFSGNLAGNGGGLYLDGASATLTNATFQGNRSTGTGGAIWASGGGSVAHNTIIWHNEASGATDTQSASLQGSLTFTHSVVENINFSSGSGNFNGLNPANDPVFVLPGNPSAAPDSSADLRLTAGSPLVDAGDDTANATTSDLGGGPRFFDGDGDLAATIDLGAYEVSGPVVVNPLAPLIIPPGSPDQIDIADLSTIFDTSAGGFAIASVANPLFSASLSGPDLSLTAIQSTPGVSLITVSALNGTGTTYYQIVVALAYDPIYVDSTAATTGDGTSWATAFRTVAEALAATDPFADDPVTFNIWVAGGTYFPDEGPGQAADDRTATFSLRNRIALYGGFAGTESHLAQRNPEMTPTILSGDLTQDDGGGPPAGTNAYHVITGEAAGAVVLVDGVTIAGGLADAASSPDNSGAGARMASGVFVFRDVTWTGNVAADAGGALWGTPSGAVELTLEACRFTGNSAASGGALVVPGGLVTGSTFLANTGQSAGGAIAGSVICRDCVFEANTAPLGRAVYLGSGDSATYTNCRFSAHDFFAFYNDEGDASVINGLFSGNTGTPLFQRAGNMSVINTTISGNAGAALSVSGYTTPPPFSSTRTATLDLANCLFWNGRGPGFAEASVSVGSHATVNYEHCLIQGVDLTTTGTGNLDGANPLNDPLFVAPPDPAAAPTSGGDLRLLAESPALDAGNATANPESLDLEGTPRVQGATIDLGALEGSTLATFGLVHPALDPFADANGNGLSNFHDYAAGVEPTAPPDPSALLTTSSSPAGERFFTATRRTNASDVFAAHQWSVNLQNWFPMVLETHYTEESSVITSPGRRETTWKLLVDPATEPRWYWRRSFTAPE